jgi:hypothetical protein
MAAANLSASVLSKLEEIKNASNLDAITRLEHMDAKNFFGTSNKRQINKIYRKVSLYVHPDRNPDNVLRYAELMKILNHKKENAEDIDDIPVEDIEVMPMPDPTPAPAPAPVYGPVYEPAKYAEAVPTHNNNIYGDNAVDISESILVKKLINNDIKNTNETFTMYIDSAPLDKTKLFINFVSKESLSRKTLNPSQHRYNLDDLYMNELGAIKGYHEFIELVYSEKYVCTGIHPVLALYFYIAKKEGTDNLPIIFKKLFPYIEDYIENEVKPHAKGFYSIFGDSRVKDQYVYLIFKILSEVEVLRYDTDVFLNKMRIIVKRIYNNDMDGRINVRKDVLEHIRDRPRLKCDKLRCVIKKIASPLISTRVSDINKVLKLDKFMGGRKASRKATRKGCNTTRSGRKVTRMGGKATRSGRKVTRRGRKANH